MRLDLLAALSGAMIALQARANGELSQRLDNGLQAALVSFSSGLAIIFVITLFNSKIKEGEKWNERTKTENEIRIKFASSNIDRSMNAPDIPIFPGIFLH